MAASDMRQVWKQVFAPKSRTMKVVGLPSGSTVRIVGMDPKTNQPALWIERRFDKPSVLLGLPSFTVSDKTYQYFTNDEQFDSTVYTYIGSCRMGNDFAHVYEKVK